MPLHLLGKKSWNVYNPENIARVRRDEAVAQARDEEDEREQRAASAASRLQMLRGVVEEPVVPLVDTTARIKRVETLDTPAEHNGLLSRKRRKLGGEDDTDRDIRLARNDFETRTANSSLPRHDLALFDSKGNIDLVNPEYRQQKLQQQSQKSTQKDEDNIGMRLKDAAGYKADGSEPWYTTPNTTADSSDIVAGITSGRDVWGNEDPRRREREKSRLDANDPLAAMKKGVRRLREVEKQKKSWMAQRERDLYEVETLARKANGSGDGGGGKSNSSRKHRHHHRHHDHGYSDGHSHGHRSRGQDEDEDEKGSLEGFSLDAQPAPATATATSGHDGPVNDRSCSRKDDIDLKGARRRNGERDDERERERKRKRHRSRSTERRESSYHKHRHRHRHFP